jgi:transposase
MDAPVDLTDEQWALLEPFLKEKPRRADGRGRPWRSSREVLNAILWVLKTGARWSDLPDRYPPYQTCHRRFQQWVRDGSFERIVQKLAADLRDRGGLDLEEGYIDGTFVPAKKGAFAWGKLSGARARRSWQYQTALVFLSPVASKALRRTR